MAVVSEPLLLPVAIAALRPTQITVGMREVELKRKAWRARNPKKGDKFLGQHMIPTILGPEKQHFVIDHHHMALALLEEGVEAVLVRAVADLRRVEPTIFWAVMDSRGWVHPFDAKGKRRDYQDIPKSLRKLSDDPFRSLAGALCRAGGYSKETLPFSEFLWADYLRHRMKRTLVEREFDKALLKAMALAKSQDADYLPGWCGPSPEG